MTRFLEVLMSILRAIFAKPQPPETPDPEPSPEDDPVVDLPPESPANPIPISLGEGAMIVAREKIGQKERTGNNDGPFVEMIHQFIDGRPKSGDPWCAAFASWCIYQASDRYHLPKRFVKSAASSEIYARAKKDGTLLSKPEGFCLGLVRGDGGVKGKTHHHTFLANATVPFPNDPGAVWSVDGNYSNSVMRTSHRIADCDFIAIR